jgi:hypothetical protein
VLKTHRWLSDRYCRHVGHDPAQHWQWISDSDEMVRFLYGFFGWRCDIRRGKNGRHCPGIGYKSSLESFWKWWHLVLKQETGSGLSKETIVKVEDVSHQFPFYPGPRRNGH